MDLNRQTRRASEAACSSVAVAVESLECRLFLSADSHMRAQHQPLHRHHSVAATAARTAAPMYVALTHTVRHSGKAKQAATLTATPQGYSPSRLATAYGINNIKFGSIVGDGTGQTIAIVDAYRNPNIAADLHAFDLQYGLPDPTLTVVNQTGGSVSSVPLDTTGWALEIALDVEWAHAMAPGANLLLVEANTNSFNDLIDGAVGYARSQPGVVAVSMSWGGGEWSTEAADEDFNFTTPAGHAPVTFLAATGDHGTPATYPAYSPNVVAVGGTSLTTDSNGNNATETGWSGSGGGISMYESQPAFQQGTVTQVTQSLTMRTAPDVSIDADPNHGGVSVYDSYTNGTSTPWETVGGTSLSTPVWAALVAIAAQGRAAAGLQPLDGASTLLPRLYNVPTSLFRDEITGSNGKNGVYSAGVGYDLVTGIGSPLANQLVPRLVAAGPFVVQSAAQGGPVSSNTPVSSITFNFSEPMDTTSFSLGTGVASFTGPGGVDLSGQITGFSWINSTTLQINFATQGAAGTYTMALTAALKSALGTPMDQNGNYIPGEATDGGASSFIITPSTIANRAIFYNNSLYDGNDPTANATTDNAAIAPDKSALLPGQSAAFANYTSYDKGINGVIIDLANLGGRTPTLGDFSFAAGNASIPANWTAAPAPASVTVFRGAGVNGSDRIEIIWPDYSIRNEWLQVTMNANGNTGLAAADTFYFGNLVGKTTATTTSAMVSIGDVVGVKFHSGQSAPISSPYDINRDGFVGILDVVTVKFDQGHVLLFPFSP